MSDTSSKKIAAWLSENHSLGSLHMGSLFYNNFFHHRWLQPRVQRGYIPNILLRLFSRMLRLEWHLDVRLWLSVWLSRWWSSVFCQGRVLPGLATNSFCSVSFQKPIDLPRGKLMTRDRGDTFHVYSSQQLPCLRLGPLKGFFSCFKGPGLTP